MKMKTSCPSSCNAHETLSRNGCISKILRHILCLSSFPWCPFDHLKLEKESSLDCSDSGTPGIVVRLMGLDSIPRFEPSPATSCSDSLTRSSQVRRPRIIPNYQELQDDNFFIMSFESHIEFSKNSKEMELAVGVKSKKKKKKSMRRRENLQESNKENEHVITVSKENLDCQKDKSFDEENSSNVVRPSINSWENSERKRKKKGNFETEADSENSSPNSVLEFLEFPTHQQTASSGNISRLANSKMRRTLSEELENCGKLEKKLINNGFGKQEKVSILYQNYAEKWDEIAKLAAREMTKVTWIHKGTSKLDHNVKEIATDLASKILDHLLNDLIHNIP